MSTNPAFAYDEVKRRFRNRDTLFLKLSNRFMGNLEQYRAEIAKHREGSNPDEVRQWAHSLAGVVGNLGGMRTFDAAKALEFAAEERQEVTILARLDDVETELEVFEAELQRKIEELSGE